MSECCSPSDNLNRIPRKHRCPVNGKEYTEVSSRTIVHHIKEPWKLENKEQGYYFCDDPECDVVYFGQDDSIIGKQNLRTTVGVKQNTEESLVCYCFGVNRQEAATNSAAKAFVLKNTKNDTCACEIRNPSGRCCLKDFPKKTRPKNNIV